jgi:hypothetical protein
MRERVHRIALDNLCVFGNGRALKIESPFCSGVDVSYGIRPEKCDAFAAVVANAIIVKSAVAFGANVPAEGLRCEIRDGIVDCTVSGYSASCIDNRFEI